jgi:hypothetical protein
MLLRSGFERRRGLSDRVPQQRRGSGVSAPLAPGSTALSSGKQRGRILS